jgi:hypothetical protein
MNRRSLVIALALVGGLAGPALAQGDFAAAKSRGECESMHGVWDQEMNVCVAKNSHRACQLAGGVWDEGTSTCSPKL